MPPGLWKKGVGAEAGAVAGNPAGSTENIRDAVALVCEGLSFNKRCAFFGIAVAAIFFILINLSEEI